MDYNEVIKLTPNDAGAYNSRCFARAIVGVELQGALSDCNESLRLKPDDADAVDSRAFTYLKLTQYGEAIADYNRALALNPKLASSLYGRGLAKRRNGDAAAGDADVAAAKEIRSVIADDFARYRMRE